MSTLKTHNLQSADSGSVNIALTANAGMIVTGISTFNDRINIGSLGVTTNFTVAGISTFSGQLNVGSNIKLGTAGVVTATSFVGSGANLTSIPAGNLTGTVADARISTLTASKLTGALPAISGASLTGISAGLFAGGATGIHTASNVGIQTTNITRTNLVGAGSSLVGMYIGDGSILFNKTLNRTGGYYISTEVNALNAGPVTLDATMTLDGTWVIV